MTDQVSATLKNVASCCSKSAYLFNRHVSSRLTYTLLALSLVITRLVDAAIGLIVAPLSFMTLGKIKPLNDVAFRALQATGLIHDLFYCTIRLINPQIN